MGRLLEALKAETETVGAATLATPATREPKKTYEPRKVAKVAGVAAGAMPQTGQAASDALRARCREACRGLPVSPADLLASLNEADKAAQLSGEEGPDVLRAFAECLAERAKPALDAKIERAYRWCRAELERHPEYHRTLCTVDPDADPVLIAVAVRGAGCACLRIERQNYAGREFELLELIHRTDAAEPATTQEAI